MHESGCERDSVQRKESSHWTNLRREAAGIEDGEKGSGAG